MFISHQPIITIIMVLNMSQFGGEGVRVGFFSIFSQNELSASLNKNNFYLICNFYEGNCLLLSYKH